MSLTYYNILIVYTIKNKSMTVNKPKKIKKFEFLDLSNLPIFSIYLCVTIFRPKSQKNRSSLCLQHSFTEKGVKKIFFSDFFSLFCFHFHLRSQATLPISLALVLQRAQVERRREGCALPIRLHGQVVVVEASSRHSTMCSFGSPWLH